MKARWLIVPFILFDLVTAGVTWRTGARDFSDMPFFQLGLYAAAMLVCSFLMFGGRTWLLKTLACIALIGGLGLTALTCNAWFPLLR